MLVIREANVNTVLPLAMMFLKEEGKYVTSRGMETVEYPSPVTSVYTRPVERVLFSPIRDANPFFHFFESLWILAGRNDVKWVSEFNSNIWAYSDNGVTFRGAYGDRMRNFGTCPDQLNTVIRLLREEPDTRRAVVSLWDPARDLRVMSVDVPCNNLLYFKIREGRLNLTVCNRSNDAIWGCYGANVVQFSVIQEYVAAMLGVGIGTYTQVSDSLHAYTSNPLWDKLKVLGYGDMVNPYEFGESLSVCPLVTHTSTFDMDLRDFMVLTDGGVSRLEPVFDNRIFNEVAVPLWNMWKARKFGGAWQAEMAKAPVANNDWLVAAAQWCHRRQIAKGEVGC